MKKKILFYVIMSVSVVLLIEFVSYVAFFIIEKQPFSFADTESKQASQYLKTDFIKSVSVQQTYNFLDNLDMADIIASKTEHIKKAVFTINDDTREVLYSHTNSEVKYKEIAIFRNAKLNFGIGLNENAWDKRGDVVL